MEIMEKNVFGICRALREETMKIRTKINIILEKMVEFIQNKKIYINEYITLCLNNENKHIK